MFSSMVNKIKQMRNKNIGKINNKHLVGTNQPAIPYEKKKKEKETAKPKKPELVAKIA